MPAIITINPIKSTIPAYSSIGFGDDAAHVGIPSKAVEWPRSFVGTRRRGLNVRRRAAAAGIGDDGKVDPVMKTEGFEDGRRKKKEKEMVAAVISGVEMATENEEEGNGGSGFARIPERLKVVWLMAFAMCLCNADRVVMSVAIVPLADRYGWSSSFIGIVQVSFLSSYFFSLINNFFYNDNT